MGAAGHLGRCWIYLTIPIFHLGFMYTLVWELGRGIIPSLRICGWVHCPQDQTELPQLRNKLAQLSPKSSELCGYFLSFSPCIFLFAVWIFPFHRKSQLPNPQLSPGPDGLLPLSFFPHQPNHFFVDSLGGKKGFVHPPLGRAAPYQDRWRPSLFLSVSREEDSTAYFETCSTDWQLSN